MSDKPDTTWKPTPELLAALADGELDAREDAAELRARIETWLAANPQGQAEVAAIGRLKSLLERTQPQSPTAETWREVLGRVESMQTTVPARRPSYANWLMGGVAVAACVLWAVLLAGSFRQKPEVPEVFAVATDQDIEIIHIEGNAIGSLVVGALPLRGELELADAGDVTLVSLTPDRRDNMKPMTPESTRVPMFWAKLDNE